MSNSFCAVKFHYRLLLLPVWFLLVTFITLPAISADNAKPLLMVHYMPWYQTPPASDKYGWHWTMNHFDPQTGVAASHYCPSIGFYDSSDPRTLEYHVLLMKIAGIDGAIIDWYGTDDYLDYGSNHRNTQKLIEWLKRANLSFAINYEDQTVPALIAGGLFTSASAVTHCKQMFDWMNKNWFHQANYCLINKRPLLLVFGPQYFKDADWDELFERVSPKPELFTLQNPCGPAVGAFGWPQPKEGTAKSDDLLNQFYLRSNKWPLSIPAAYPRFHDIYSEAGVRESWGNIEDRSGQTFNSTIERALLSNAALIQLVTWNDWGEGTQIEPSTQFGFRDLEVIQAMRRKYLNPKFAFTAQDLRLPQRIYKLRVDYQNDVTKQHELDTAATLLIAGKVAEARAILDK
jgi:hypothetical protein